MLRRLFVVLMLAACGWGAVARAQTAPPLAQPGDAQKAEACRALEGSRFHGLAGAPTHVMSAAFVAATPRRVAYCEVHGYVNPTINFGMFLPTDNWNGKFIVRGCGGSCGSVAVEQACGHHLRVGYACLHTDMGHVSSMVDNNWVANNLQGLVDFGYRATHVTTVAGKAITEAFYARPPRLTYFFACSTGGRQGMVEAQRFPQDFDGIVAIAPASMGPFGPRPADSETLPQVFNFDASGKQIMPNRKALLVHAAVVRDCDMNDGVKDGLIGDPRLCRFDPAELRCKGADIRNCLTEAQVGVVRKIYAGRGAMKGSEFNWIGAYLNNATLPGEARRPIVNLGEGRGDPALIDTLNSPANPDLRPFKARGGKLIMVHGWSDQSVAPLPSVDYYETMTRTMGGRATTIDFARLFMVPGMDHCSGGEGAYAIDYVGALEDWVERGKAPDKLVGFHPVAGAPLDYFSVNLPITDPKYLEFSRPHFPYPAVARYSGKGDPKLAASFVAVNP